MKGTVASWFKCTGLQIEWIRFEPWPGALLVFLGKTLYTRSSFFHPGVFNNYPAKLDGISSDT